MPPIEVVDSQLHELQPCIPVGEDDGHSAPHQDALATEVLLAMMDAVGVGAAVLSTLRTSWARYAVSRFPDRFAYIVSAGAGQTLDITLDDLEERVASLRSSPGALGIRVSRFGPNAERIQPLLDGHYEDMFAVAEKHEVPVCIYLPGHLDFAADLARRHEALTLVLDHCGIQQPMPHNKGMADSPRFKRLGELLALAAFPNIALKLTGVCTLSEDGYPFDDLWPPLHQLLDAFGSERLVWGSDITRVMGRSRPPAGEAFDTDLLRDYRGKHTYAEAVSFIRDTSEVSSSEKQMILGGSLRTLFRW